MKIIPPNLAPELSHLSEEQIDTLYQRYLGDEKVKDLIDEYDIDCRPMSLIRLFPPELLHDSPCPHCDTIMYGLRASKSQGQFAGKTRQCPSCGHSENSLYQNYCSCEHCEADRLREAVEAEQSARDKISSDYNLDKIRPCNFETLTFRQQVLLLSLLRELGSQSLSNIQPLCTEMPDRPFAPTFKDGVQKLEELYDEQIIAVDPESDIDAFVESKDYESFRVTQVAWIVNVSLPNETSSRASAAEVMELLSAQLAGPIDEDDYEQARILIEEVSVGEVLSALYFWTDEYDLKFTAIPKTTQAIKELLPNLTVSQIRFLAKKATESAALYYSRHPDICRNRAANTIPSKLLESGQKAIKNEWNLKNFARLDIIPRSQISRILFDHVLDTQDGGYTMLPNEFDFNEAQDELAGLEADETGCKECGGKLSTPRFHGSKLELLCVECGAVSTLLVQPEGEAASENIKTEN